MSKPFKKFVEPAAPRPYADVESAASRLLEIAKTIGADKRGLIPVGVWNATFLHRDKANAAEYASGRDHLIAGGLIELHGSGSYIMFGPNCAPEDRAQRSEELKMPYASLGLA